MIIFKTHSIYFVYTMIQALDGRGSHERIGGGLEIVLHLESKPKSKELHGDRHDAYHVASPTCLVSGNT
jgi:hypothetical protein